MKTALSLARRGSYKTHPNPRVGAVLVKHGRIIGRGSHEYFGGPHAEVNAVRGARGEVSGSTLYVTLEPCAYFGKTPPCADFIVSQGIKEVWIGSIDPNPLVSGKGVKILKKAGLRVKTGMMKRECDALNADLYCWIKKQMPYVIVKAAQSLDGKIATRIGESRWITDKPARVFSHKLRAASDAILVGANTVLRDDPSLGVRHVKCTRQPVKVILDSQLRVSPQAKIFSKKIQSRVILAVTKRAVESRRKLFKGKAEVLEVKEKNGRVDLRALLSVLGKRGFLRVMIEGGGEVIAEALKEKLVHEVYFFIAPKLIGGRKAFSSVAGVGIAHLKNAVSIEKADVRRLGRDFLIHGTI